MLSNHKGCLFSKLSLIRKGGTDIGFDAVNFVIDRSVRHSQMRLSGLVGGMDRGAHPCYNWPHHFHYIREQQFASVLLLGRFVKKFILFEAISEALDEEHFRFYSTDLERAAPNS